jgi:hypothetical protein
LVTFTPKNGSSSLKFGLNPLKAYFKSMRYAFRKDHAQTAADRHIELCKNPDCDPVESTKAYQLWQSRRDSQKKVEKWSFLTHLAGAALCLMPIIILANMLIPTLIITIPAMALGLYLSDKTHNGMLDYLYRRDREKNHNDKDW